MEKKYTIKGFTGTIYEIADHFNINRNTILGRIRQYGICDDIVKPVRKLKHHRNTIYEALGIKGNVLSFSMKFNISGTIIRRYLKQGMEMEDILKTVKGRRTYAVLGFQGNIKEIAKHFNISRVTIHKNMREGKTLEEIITNHVDRMKRKRG